MFNNLTCPANHGAALSSSSSSMQDLHDLLHVLTITIAVLATISFVATMTVAYLVLGGRALCDLMRRVVPSLILGVSIGQLPWVFQLGLTLAAVLLIPFLIVTWRLLVQHRAEHPLVQTTQRVGERFLWLVAFIIQAHFVYLCYSKYWPAFLASPPVLFSIRNRLFL